MSSDDYGNLGQEMKAMKNGRKKLMVETQGQGRKRNAETKKFMGNVKAANADLKGQTHKMLAGMHKEMADLKVEVGQILGDADDFMAQTAAQTRKTLAKDRRRISGDTEAFMAATTKANKKLQTQTHQMLGEADEMVDDLRKDVKALKREAQAMVTGFAQASRERASAWQDTLRTVQGNSRGASAGTAVMARPKKTKPKAKPKTKAKGSKKSQAKKR